MTMPETVLTENPTNQTNAKPSRAPKARPTTASRPAPAVADETGEEKPDFSNYSWFPGTNAKFNAVSVSTHEGRIFVGVKGFDKRSNAHGYIQAEFSRESLQELCVLLQGLLAQPA